MIFILSQIIVVLSNVFYIVALLNKKKVYLTLNLCISDILFAVHFALLDGITGAVVIIIDAVYLLVVYFLEKNNKQITIYVCTGITTALIIVASILTWSSWSSIFPMMAMLVYLTSMFFTNIIITRGGSFCRGLFNLVYLIIIGSYAGVVLSGVSLICTIVGFIILAKKQKNTDINENEQP